MHKYGCEIILCSKLDNEFIDRLDIKKYSEECKNLVFQVENTRCIDKNTLKYLNSLKEKYNIDIKISVVGPYVVRNNFNETEKETLFLKTLYCLDELYHIITNFEEIESIIEPHLNQFDIAIYLIDTIARKIMYDPEYLLMKHKNIPIPKIVGEFSEADFYDRSLRGILSGKTVCAGYSLIFKELANRNGIKCEYVSGKLYSSSGIEYGGHAWNLLEIDGVRYPIDITNINKKYQNGDFTSLGAFSCDVEKFKMTHRPYDEKYNYGLTKMNEDAIKKAKQKTCIIKQYNSTTYKISRKDKSQFILSQVGIYKGLYKYVYFGIDSDGSYKPGKVVFSESNLAREIDKKKFERSDYYDEFIDSFVSVLFSKENLNDSLNIKKTNYIGSAELVGESGFVKNNYEIKKSDRAVKACRVHNSITYKMNNGKVVVFVQLKNATNNDKLYGYFLYLLSDGPSVIEYDFYSNIDYFASERLSEMHSILNNDYLNTFQENNRVKK